MRAACHCGRSALTLSKLAASVTECNCSICRRYGTLWGYHHMEDVELSALQYMSGYQWGDGALTFHRCSSCGCIMCWTLTKADGAASTRMGVNYRMLESGAALRLPRKYFDGASSFKEVSLSEWLSVGAVHTKLREPATPDWWAGVEALDKIDPRFGQLAADFGVPDFEGGGDPFTSLLRAIVFQQLHGKAAASIFARLVALVGNPVQPEAVLRHRDGLRNVGLSRAKAEYVAALAEGFRSGALNADLFTSDNAEKISHALQTIHGIGPWTVDMFLMSNLLFQDILPTGDFGVRSGAGIFFELKEQPKPRELTEMAESWRPWRSLASWYMWRVTEL